MIHFARVVCQYIFAFPSSVPVTTELIPQTLTSDFLHAKLPHVSRPDDWGLHCHRVSSRLFSCIPSHGLRLLGSCTGRYSRLHPHLRLRLFFVRRGGP